MGKRLSAAIASIAAVGLCAPLTAAQPPQVHTVAISEFAFVPNWIEVHVGDTVTWTNNDLVLHTATALDASWTTGTLTNGGSGSFVAKTAGSFRYHCVFHEAMIGMVVVTPN